MVANISTHQRQERTSMPEFVGDYRPEARVSVANFARECIHRVKAGQRPTFQQHPTRQASDQPFDFPRLRPATPANSLNAPADGVVVLLGRAKFVMVE